MNNELVSLEDNDTQQIAKLTHGKMDIGTKWIYTIKNHSDQLVGSF